MSVIKHNIIKLKNLFFNIVTPFLFGIIVLFSFSTHVLAGNPNNPDISINDVSVNENAGTATFTISFSHTPRSSLGDIVINYSTSNGTATAGSDYTAATGSLTFNNSSDKDQTFTVSVTDDSATESSETVNISISKSSESGTITDATGVLTIADNDITPSLSIADVTTSDESASNASLTITLSATSSNDVTVNYATSNGTATAGADYTATSGTATISAGATTATIAVPILADTVDEANETVTLTLSSANNATISDSTATLTITDDDESESASAGTDGANGLNLTSSSNVTTSSNITGSNGENASGSPSSTATGVSGGAGGSGVNGTSFTLLNSSLINITGGNGGLAGNGGTSTADGIGGAGGTGGAGGSGVSGTGFTLTNNGTISGGDGGTGGNGGKASARATSGKGGNGGDGGSGIKGSGFNLVNTGTITGGAGGSAGNIGSILVTSGPNAGSAGDAGSAGSAGYGIFVVPGEETNITNLTGTITSSTYDIYNTGSIGTLSNGQSNLDYSGALPENYNTYIASTSDYGKIDFTNVTGTMAYDIYSTSQVTETTYTSVLDGITSDQISTTRTGSFGAYTWTLKLADGDTDTWDLTLVADQEELIYTNRFEASGIDISDAAMMKFCNILVELKNSGVNSELHEVLDGLSNTEFKKTVMSIKGKSVAKTAGGSAASQKSFSTATSVASNISQSKTTLLTLNALTHNISLSDLTHYGLTGDSYKSSFNYSDKGLLGFLKKNKNRNIFTASLANTDVFVRTFGSLSNYNALNDGDTGYVSESFGILFGNQKMMNENYYTGYSFGLSESTMKNDGDSGGSDTINLHYSTFKKLDFDDYSINLNLGGLITQKETERKTLGVIQTLTSKGTDFGLDAKLSFTKKLSIGAFNFTPTIGFGANYLFQDDIEEEGGSLALDVKTQNLLLFEPEIGFNFDRNLRNTSTHSSNLTFSFMASEKDYVDGTSSLSYLTGASTPYEINMIDTKKTHLTLGLGYNLLNTEENSKLDFNVFHTDTDDESLNNSLFSFSYNKSF